MDKTRVKKPRGDIMIEIFLVSQGSFRVTFLNAHNMLNGEYWNPK